MTRRRLVSAGFLGLLLALTGALASVAGFGSAQGSAGGAAINPSTEIITIGDSLGNVSQINGPTDQPLWVEAGDAQNLELRVVGAANTVRFYGGASGTTNYVDVGNGQVYVQDTATLYLEGEGTVGSPVLEFGDGASGVFHDSSGDGEIRLSVAGYDAGGFLRGGVWRVGEIAPLDSSTDLTLRDNTGTAGATVTATGLMLSADEYTSAAAGNHNLYFGYNTGSGFRANNALGYHVVAIDVNGSPSLLLSNQADSGIGLNLVVDGTAARPAFVIDANAADTDTGLYNAGANQLGITAGGTAQGIWTSSGLEMQSGAQIFAASDISASAPPLSFVGDPDTGFSLGGGNEVRGVAGGASIIGFAAGGFSTYVAGSASAPAIALNNATASDTNTGLYKPADDQIGISAGGSQIAAVTSGGISHGASVANGPTTTGAGGISLTDATPTTVATITLAASETVSARITVGVRADDGTDIQQDVATYHVSIINNAGTLTTTGVTEIDETGVTTTGTLTMALTINDGGSGVANLQMDANSSLTSPTITATIKVECLSPGKTWTFP